ncbi:unnamed protein product [Closterium sp. NIES-53]
MYALTDSAEGDCYLCVSTDPGIEAAALGASESVAPGTSASSARGTSESLAPGAGESALSGTTRIEALHTFTLDSGASCSFFCDSTTLTPLSRPVAVSLADPSGGQVLASSSTVLPCPAAPSGLLSGLHLPSFSTNLGHERYFLLVIDDYSRYTTVFPLRRKDRGGEISSDLLRAFYRAEGIRETFTLPASPQQNGIAERRIGMYAAHQINLQPRVSLPETTPTLRWTGKVGDASVLRVWGSRAFVRDTSADKLSSHAVPCVFLGLASPLTHLGGSFTTPPRVMFCPLRTSRAARGAESAGAGPRGAEPAGAGPRGAEPGVADSEGAEPEGMEPGGAEPGGAESGGAQPGGAESGGPAGVPSRREPLSPQRLREWYARRCSRAVGATGPAAGGAYGVGATGGAAGAGAAGAAGPRGAGAGGTGAVGGPAGVGAAGGARAAGPGGARTGAIATGGAAGAGVVGRTGAGGAAEGTGAVSAVFGGAARPAAVLRSAPSASFGLPPSTGPTPPLLSPPPVKSQSQLQPASPLPGPSPYSGPTRGLTERRELESRPALPESRTASRESRPESTVRTGRRVPRQRPPPVPGTHSMTLRPSNAPQCVPLPSPPASSLTDSPDPESDSLRAASPTVTRFLATAVTDHSFESTAASALVAELVDFAAACRLDYAASLVVESESASVCPPSVEGECALGMDVLEDRQEDFECFAVALPHLVSMLLAPEGDPHPDPALLRRGDRGSLLLSVADSPGQRDGFVEVHRHLHRRGSPPEANIVSGMWIFWVKRPPCSPPVFKAGNVARGFSQQQGVDFFQTFSPFPKMTTLWVLLHVAAQRDYELHSLNFSTAFLQGSLHEEIWLRR